MGLLDDAIREHLELKRQHGASDEEISQKEAEALGPARRGFPAQTAETAEGAEAAEAVEAEGEPPDAAPVEPAPALDEEHQPLEPPTFEPVAEEPTAVEPPTSEPVVDEPPAVEPPLRPEPPPFEGPPPFDEEPPVEEPTEEPPAAEEPAEEKPQGDEDVLEETPEFLQDAPEHDRLWFEQKPPRDFDFE